MKLGIVLFYALSLTTSALADTIRVGMPNRINSLDPVGATNAQERFLLPLLFQPLFYIDQAGSILPSLAESYEEVEKGVVKLKIKKNQRFSDGSLLAASDVVASLKTLCAKGSYNLIPIRTLVGCEKGGAPQVIAVNNNELTFKLRGSLNYFLYELASPFLFIFKSTPGGIIGSGEFKKKFLSESKAIIERVNSVAGMPNEMELFYITEKGVTDELQANKIDIASMFVDRDIQKIDLQRFKKISTSNDVVTVITINPKRIKDVPESILRQIGSELKSDLQLSKCDTSKTIANGIVPEGIGGYLNTQIDSAYSKTLKLPKPITLNIHVAADRLIDCETMAFEHIMLRHNIHIKIIYEADYIKLKLNYGTDNIDGYLEHFVFYTRDAGRFFSRFTSFSNAPVFYIQSRKVEELMKDAENSSEIQTRFGIYRKINAVIETYHNLFPLNYMGHSIIWNKCISFKGSSGNTPTNPNTFLYLRDAYKTNCTGS
ncbi:MAG: hypothetical protein H7069_13055 [Phormidesmis sp. FL-bin-119]|nr:hypothetical protein [Pedobacter sp.]